MDEATVSEDHLNGLANSEPKDVQTTVAKPMAQRAACDRCRGQKLRCPRTKPGSCTVCDRCQRIGAICRTAPRLPSGRPSLRGCDGSRRRAHARNNRQKPRTGGQPELLERKQVTQITTLPSPSSSTSPSLRTTSSLGDINDDRPAHGLPSDQSSTFGDYQNTSFEIDDLTMDSFDRNTCCSFDFDDSSPLRIHPQNGDFRDPYTSSAAAPMYTTNTLALDDAVDVRLLIEQNFSSPLVLPQLVGINNREFIDSISSISERATGLLGLQWTIWDPPIANCVISEECIHDRYGSRTEFSSDRWSLTEVFELTTDFVKLLRVTRHRLTSAEASTKSLLSLSNLLMVLSTCIQIGQLLELVLSRIRNKSQELGDPQQLTSPSLASSNLCTQAACRPWQHSVYTIIQIIENHCCSLKQHMWLSCDATQPGEPKLNIIDLLSIDGPSSPLVNTLNSQIRDILSGLTHNTELAKQETLGC